MKVVSDLLQREVDQHVSDLGSVLLSRQRDDELIDFLSDNLFSVLIGLNNAGNYGADSAQVTEGKGVLLHLRVYGRHTNEHSRVGHLSHWGHCLGHGSGQLLHLGLRLGSGLSIGLSSHLRSSLEVAAWLTHLSHMSSLFTHGSILRL